MAYGATFAASGVATGAARPMNFETLLSPELAVHTDPDASTATPVGPFNDPNPADGESGAADPKLNCASAPLVVSFATQIEVPSPATPAGLLMPVVAGEAAAAVPPDVN